MEIYPDAASSPPKVDLPVRHPCVRNSFLPFLSLIPKELVVAVDAPHVPAPVSLRDQNAAIGTVGPAVVDTELVAFHVVQRAERGVERRDHEASVAVFAAVRTVRVPKPSNALGSIALGTVHRSHAFGLLDFGQDKHFVVISNFVGRSENTVLCHLRRVDRLVAKRMEASEWVALGRLLRVGDVHTMKALPARDLVPLALGG